MGRRRTERAAPVPVVNHEGDRRIEYMPLGGIPSAKRNPKKHAIAKLIESMSTFGFGEPPLLDERTGRLVAGHGRIETLAAMLERKMPLPSGIRLGADGNWHVPVVRGWASKTDKQAEAYLVGSNKNSEAGGWDDDLAELLTELAETGDLAGSGYDQEEIEKLLAGAGDAADLMDPSDGGASREGAVAGNFLKWGTIHIPFTEEEAEAFTRKVGDYIAKSGSVYGLGRVILNGF